MAVANTKSAVITNLDASPAVMSQDQGSRVRVRSGTVAVAAGDDDGSVYRFVRVQSTDKLLSIHCVHDTVLAGTGYECGLYDTAANGGAAVDIDCYQGEFTMVGAVPAVPHVLATAAYHELLWGAVHGVEDIEQRVWADAGLSADSKTSYDICLTAGTVGTAAGDISMIVYYVDGS